LQLSFVPHIPGRQGFATITAKYSPVMIRTPIPLIAIFACLALGAAAQEPPVALTGGTVYPVSHAPFHNGTVLLAGGKIAAIGAHVKIPVGARVLEADAVMPGIVRACSQMDVAASAGTRARFDPHPHANGRPNRARAIGAPPPRGAP
jgi:hypothetical protein